MIFNFNALSLLKTRLIIKLFIMLTFEEIKEMAKKFAMERAKTDNVNVWYIRKL